MRDGVLPIELTPKVGISGPIHSAAQGDTRWGKWSFLFLKLCQMTTYDSNGICDVQIHTILEKQEDPGEKTG